MKNNFYVYCWTNNLNEKRYVGKGKGNRFNAHVKESQREKPRTPLSCAMKKYGIENFSLMMLDQGLQEQIAYDREMFWVDFLDSKVPNGYNRDSGGKGCTAPCDETRQKISLARRGKTLSPETRQKLSIAHKGKTHTPETREKLSLAAKNRSPETREKIGAIHRGKTLSDETRQKMSIAKRNMSDETRQKMSIAKRNMSDETREKISIANRGKTLSDEIRQKMSFAQRGDLNPNSKKRRAIKHLLTFFEKLCK